MKTQQCIVCEQEKSDGILIFTHFICTECEAEIIQTDVKDVKYPYFIHRLRKLWYKKDA